MQNEEELYVELPVMKVRDRIYVDVVDLRAYFGDDEQYPITIADLVRLANVKMALDVGDTVYIDITPLAAILGKQPPFDDWQQRRKA